MSSVDEEVQEPFKLSIETLQGKWLCEELGVSLKVTGGTVQYASGECYPLEVTPEGKLEIFGYRGVEKKSDSSTVIWKHKETGHSLTWMYEGDNEDQEPEVDSSLIIQNSSGGRTTRKRKVDYVALDKVLDADDSSLASSKQSAWQSLRDDLHSANSSKSSGPSESEIADAFMHLKHRFEEWLRSTNTSRFREIVSKRGYLSTELKCDPSSSGIAAASRFVNYLKSIGAKAWDGQESHALNVRVPESLWNKSVDVVQSQGIERSKDSKDASDLISRVNAIKATIIRYIEKSESDQVTESQLIDALSDLDSLPVDLDTLKETRVGVEINRLSKTHERAKKSLEKLKSIYLESKKE